MSNAALIRELTKLWNRAAGLWEWQMDRQGHSPEVLRAVTEYESAWNSVERRVRAGDKAGAKGAMRKCQRIAAKFWRRTPLEDDALQLLNEV